MAGDGEGNNNDNADSGQDTASAEGPDSAQTDAEATEAAAKSEPQVSTSMEQEQVKDIAPDPWMSNRLGMTPDHFSAVIAQALGRQNIDQAQISATLDKAKEQFGFTLSKEDQQKAVAVGVMEKGALDYAKSLPTTDVDSIVSAARDAYDQAKADLGPTQQMNMQAFDTKGVAAKAQSFVDSREAFRDSIITGRMADLTQENYKDTMNLALGFGVSQPGQVAQAQFGGYSPGQINAAANVGIGDIIGSVLSNNPVSAVGVIGKALSKDLEDRLAFDKIANPLGQLGILGKVAEVATNFLGPFAAPAKMGVQAIGMLAGPSYTDFSRSPAFAGPSAPDGDNGMPKLELPVQSALPTQLEKPQSLNDTLDQIFGKQETAPITLGF